MITRRDSIKLVGATAALASSTASLASAGTAGQGLDAFLLDDRFAAMWQSDAMRAGSPAMLRFAGDVTRVWFEQIDPKWRARGFVLGGITGTDSLFLLEMLGHQQGRHVTHRTVLGPKDDRGVAPVSWIIAPHHPSVLA